MPKPPLRVRILQLALEGVGVAVALYAVARLNPTVALLLFAAVLIGAAQFWTELL